MLLTVPVLMVLSSKQPQRLHPPVLLTVPVLIVPSSKQPQRLHPPVLLTVPVLIVPSSKQLQRLYLPSHPISHPQVTWGWCLYCHIFENCFGCLFFANIIKL